MKDELDKIADYLLLQGGGLPDPGLFHGKTGIVVALYLYAEACRDEVLRDYAWELFQQVYDSVHTLMPVGLESGLAGVGYGVTLLCKRGLLDGDLNDILADVDGKIMEHDPRRMADLSVRTGVRGLMLYLDLRRSVAPVSTFVGLYLSELQAVAARHGVAQASSPPLLSLLDAPTFSEAEYAGRPLGIDRGSAYYLLKSVWP